MISIKLPHRFTRIPLRECLTKSIGLFLVSGNHGLLQNYTTYIRIQHKGVLVKRCSNFVEIALLHGLPHDLLYSNWVKKGNKISVYDSCSPFNKKHHTKTRRGFWENLKRYYYTIRKSITWKLSVVTYRVFFCSNLKGFTYTNGNSQTVIFNLWHHCTKNEVFN